MCAFTAESDGNAAIFRSKAAMLDELEISADYDANGKKEPEFASRGLVSRPAEDYRNAEKLFAIVFLH